MLKQHDYPVYPAYPVNPVKFLKISCQNNKDFIRNTIDTVISLSIKLSASSFFPHINLLLSDHVIDPHYIVA